MVVLEWRLQPVTVLRCLAGVLRRRGHDDVRVAVAIIAMSPVRMLDDLDEAVPVRRRVERMTVEVLVVVAVGHGAILGGRPALIADAGRSTRATSGGSRLAPAVAAPGRSPHRA